MKHLIVSKAGGSNCDDVNDTTYLTGLHSNSSACDDVNDITTLIVLNSISTN